MNDQLYGNGKSEGSIGMQGIDTRRETRDWDYRPGKCEIKSNRSHVGYIQQEAGKGTRGHTIRLADECK
jgi:hypothetical protein